MGQELPLQIAAVALLGSAIKKAEHDEEFARELWLDPSEVLIRNEFRAEGSLLPDEFKNAFLRNSKNKAKFKSYFKKNIDLTAIRLIGASRWIDSYQCVLCKVALFATALILVTLLLAYTLLTGDPTAILLIATKIKALLSLLGEPETLFTALLEMLESGKTAYSIAEWLCSKLGECP